MQLRCSDFSACAKMRRKPTSALCVERNVLAIASRLNVAVILMSGYDRARRDGAKVPVQQLRRAKALDSSRIYVSDAHLRSVVQRFVAPFSASSPQTFVALRLRSGSGPS